jgi:lipopolysaccharide biosynthesis regulator YciM
MTRLLLLLMLVLAVALVKLAEWNDQKVSFQLLPDKVLVLPQITLLVLAFALGAGLVFLVHGLSDLIRWVASLRETREEKRSERADALWKRAWTEINRSHLPQAISVLERLTALFPDHKEALLLYGDLKRASGDYVGAIRVHRRARVFDEEDVRLILALMTDYEGAGRIDDAQALLREYFKKEGRNRDILVHFRSLLIRSERWEEALSVQTVLARSFEKGERREKEIAILVGLKFEVGSLLHRDKKTDGARRSFRGALKIDPSFTPARVGLAEAQIAEGREKEGIENLVEGWDRTGQTLYLVRLEEYYLDKGNPDAVLALYERALKGRPEKGPALRFHQARLYHRLGMEEEAMSQLEALEGQAPWGGEFYRLLGDLYERHRQKEAAIETYKKALSLEISSDRPYVCQNCGTFYPDWKGRCSACHHWNTVVRTDGQMPSPAALPLILVAGADSFPETAPEVHAAYQEYFTGPHST